MYAIDFFNMPPQYSIFQKETNKTQFGGVLFLIYLIVMFFISLAYLLDYAVNEKFEIEFSIVNSFFSKINPGDMVNGRFDSGVNPEINFIYYIGINYALDPYGIPYQNISIEEIEKNLFLEMNGKLYKGKFGSNLDYYTSRGDESFFIFNITKKIYEFGNGESINVIYKCDNDVCSNFLYNTFLDVSITTENYEIIHNASNPIKKIECLPFGDEAGNTSICNNLITGYFQDNETLNLDFKITSILYKEKKGISRLFDYISGKEKNYTAALFEKETEKVEYNSKIFYLRDTHLSKENNNIKNYYYKEEEGEYEYDEDEYLEPDYDREKYYILSNIQTTPMDKYEKYLRSEIGFLSVLANIGALFSTLKVVFVVIYLFYSKKYDNYEVVEKILKTELQKGKNNKNLIKLSDKNKDIDLQMELSELNPKEKENNIDNMTMPLIKDSIGKEKDIDVKEVINSEEKISEEQKEEKALIKEEDRILPKISFFEFYFNHIYFKICKRRKNQEIMNICDKIIFKYISIDYVLYNLIRLENLFKDYKWNNPQLNSLKNNEIIKELLDII